MGKRILILGGTTEARRFAGAIAGRGDLDITLSLAGRTANPVAQPVPVRVGGFGGADGLARYLSDTRTDILVDATHPFAAVISANAVRAAAVAGAAFFAIRRPPWQPVDGDRWREAESVGDAVRLAGAAPRRIFVALGRQELGPLLEAPFHHYIIRSVDPVDPPLDVPNADYILDRGPFDEDAEIALFRNHRVELVIAKNSGGPASYAKLAAARALSLPVIIIKRPAVPEARTVGDIAAAVELLDHLIASPEERGE